MTEVLKPSDEYEKGDLMYKLDKETQKMIEVTVENLGNLKVGVDKTIRLVGMTEEMQKNERAVNIQDLVNSGTELTDSQVQSMSIEQLNAYEQAKWKSEATKNGVEFTGKMGSDNFAEIKDFDGVGLGTKEYKALKENGLQERHNALRDFLRKNNADKVKILQVEKLTGEELKNGLTNAIKATVITGDTQETILFGKDQNGKLKILSLSDQNVKGSKKYSHDFLSKKAKKSESELNEWQVNQDILFDENGKATSANIKEGEREVYIDKSEKIVEAGWVANGEEICEGDKCSQSTTETVESVDIEERLEWDHVVNMKENSDILKKEKNFHTSYEKGVQYAKEKKQDVVILAVNSDCGFCKKLYDKVINTKDFVKYAKDKTIIFQPAKYLEKAESTVLQDSGGAVPALLAISKDDYNTPILVSNGYDDKKDYKDEITDILRSS